MAKVMKKAQPGRVISSLLSKYAGKTAAKDLETTLAKMATKDAVKEATFVKNYVPLEKPKGRINNWVSESIEHKAQARKNAGLKPIAAEWEKAPFSRRFSDVRKTFNDTKYQKSGVSLRDLDKKERIRKDYEGYKSGGKIVKKAKPMTKVKQKSGGKIVKKAKTKK